jgi:hypothetical protein
MGESMKIVLRDALKMVGIVEATKDASDVPQASWDLYEMIQACIQVCGFVLSKFCVSYISLWYCHNSSNGEKLLDTVCIGLKL